MNKSISGTLKVANQTLGEQANLLSPSAMDLGIVVNSAAILMDKIFRNVQKTPRERANPFCRVLAAV
jgi:Cu/Ag efflux pump CusA